MDEAKQTKIKETINEGLKVFGLKFADTYKTLFIESVKEETNSDDEVEYFLIEPPLASWIIHKGMVTKQSDWLKQWRPRYFVVQNINENFRINFYKGDNETGKQTGFMDLCGYHPELLSEGFGLKLVPINEKRKTWNLKCKDETEQKQWFDIFDLICNKAEPPVNKDPVIRESFVEAFNATRVHYGFAGNASITCSEGEMLADLLVSVIERDVMEEAYKSMLPVMVKFIKKNINVAATTAVTAAWNALLIACEPARQAVETTVKPSIKVFFEKENEVKNKITEAISNKMNPFIEEHSKNTFTPALECIVDEVVNTFCETINSIHENLTTMVTKEEFKVEDKRKELLLELDMSITIREGPLTNAKEICDDCLKNKFTKIAKLLVGNCTLKNIADKILDKNVQLATYAVYTFTELYKEKSDSIDIVLTDILDKMVHDAIIYLNEVITDILMSMVEEPIASKLIPECQTPIAPIQQYIDSIPGGLSDFMKLDCLVEEVINDLLTNTINTASEGSFKKSNEKINELTKSVKSTIISTKKEPI